MIKVLGAVSLLLGALLWLFAPVSIIWLLILKQWWVIPVAVASLFSHFLLGLALLPAMAFSLPAAALIQRHPAIALLIALPGHLYTAALITIWCMGILTLLRSGATQGTWIPVLLLSFSVGTAPWVYMAQRETQSGGGEGSIIVTMFAQIAFAVVVIGIIIFRPLSIMPLWVTFGAIMLAEVCFSLIYTLALMRARAAYESVNQL